MRDYSTCKNASLVAPFDNLICSIFWKIAPQLEGGGGVCNPIPPGLKTSAYTILLYTITSHYTSHKSQVTSHYTTLSLYFKYLLNNYCLMVQREVQSSLYLDRSKKSYIVIVKCFTRSVQKIANAYWRRFYLNFVNISC